MTDKPNACCNDGGNLAPKGSREETPARPDLTVLVCTVCGCRHFEMQVDPGRLGLRGAALTGND